MINLLKLKNTSVLLPILQISLILVVFSSCTFSHYSKKSFRAAIQEKPFDAIVVPGIPYEGRRTSTVMKIRLYWAKFLYDSGMVKNIIFSGGAVYSPYVEGKVMKIMADSLGIPADHTFAETKAEHSTENVYNSWMMAKHMGFDKIALATDPFQAGLLKRFIKKHCKGLKSVPIVFGLVNFDEYALPVIDATAAQTLDFVSITEKENFFTRLRYTFGKRIKDERREMRKKERKEKQEIRNSQASATGH